MTVWNCIVEPHIADYWRLTNGVCPLQPPVKVIEHTSMQGAVADIAPVKELSEIIDAGSPRVAASFHISNDRDPNSTAWWLDVGCVETSR